MLNYKEKEKKEEDIQYNLKNLSVGQSENGYRTFDPEALKKNRPLKSV